MNISKELAKILDSNENKGTKPYDTKATVKRVENGVAWVHIPGGVDETPAQLTINAKPGDSVQVRVADGKAFLVGNGSAPPTDDTTARQAIDFSKIASDAANAAVRDASTARTAAASAQAAADHAEEVAEGVEAIAESAKTAADTAFTNLSQVQSVLEVAQWIATHGTYEKATVFNPNATYYTITATQVTEPSDDDKDSQGVLIYYELDNGIYVRTTDTSVDDQKTYYRVTGTPVAQPSAEHIADYYTLAVSEAMADYVQSHLALTDEGLWIIKDGSGYKLKLTDYGSYIVAPDGTTVVNQNTADGNIIRALDGTVIAHLGYGEGQSQSGTAEAPYYTLGTRASGSGIGNYSVAVGKDVESSGYISYAEGADTKATSHCSHAEGRYTEATDFYAHAEGFQSKATGSYSHAEGWGSKATASCAHAEGDHTTAGDCAHAEGESTKATALCSHAQNRGTIAAKPCQTAIGKWNVEDTDATINGKYLLIAGNGTRIDRAISRSNAFTIDWGGKVECGNYQGKLTSLLDLAHPKGSTYGTVLPPTINGHSYDDGNLTDADKDACGDTWFDPRIMWGGTWEMLPEGYILLSGSESGSYQVGTDTTSSGYKEYGANDKRIEDANIAHGHGFTQPTITSHFIDTVSYGSGSASRPYTGGSKSTTGWNTASGGAVHNLGTPSQRANFNVMQKSIAVYTWIRTA